MTFPPSHESHLTPTQQRREVSGEEILWGRRGEREREEKKEKERAQQQHVNIQQKQK